jgi:predicted  nucleic acid-binding Zn-ribbon protein
MSEHRFASLFDLVAFDQTILSVEKKVIACAEIVKDLGQTRQELYDRSTSLKNQVHDVQKQIDMLELDMKALDAREMAIKKQLEIIHSFKEYNPLKAELDVVHKDQEGIEQKLLMAWNKFEQLQQEFKIYNDSLGERIAVIDEKTSVVMQEQTELAQLLQGYVAQRETYEQKVPAEWRDKYLMMRARVPDPVVAIVDGSCSVCFNYVTPQDALRIKRGALVQCKGCYRLLYTLENVE